MVRREWKGILEQCECRGETRECKRRPRKSGFTTFMPCIDKVSSHV